jgi:predicted transcriptional regulator
LKCEKKYEIIKHIDLMIQIAPETFGMQHFVAMAELKANIKS